MKKTNYPKSYREFEHITASPELKKRILSAATHHPEQHSPAGAIALTASIAAAALLCVMVLCGVSLLRSNDGKGSDQTARQTAADAQVKAPEKDLEDASKSISVSPEETAAAKDIPALAVSDQAGLIASGPKDPSSGTETASDKELPVLRVAEADMTGGRMPFSSQESFPNPAAAEELAVQESLPNPGAAEELAVSDERFSGNDTPVNAAPDFTANEDPADSGPKDLSDPSDPEISSPDTEPFDPENPDWSLLKDHDTYSPPANYDPMLLTDKERPIYENCSHEWVTKDWGDGTEFVACSKCGVHLNVWLYNGYSE